jgi:hypothetical protein
MKLSEAKVRIRPFREMVSAYSVRQEGNYDPSSEAVLETDDDGNEFASIPDNAKRINVLVHGFNVSRDDALNGFIPAYFKRLYWAGHDVHDLQCNSEQDCAHTVGFLWPGDQHFGPGKTGGLFFPEDEFHALMSGVPFARFLKKEVDPNGDRFVTVIAHSLGTMVVNSALMQPDPERPDPEIPRPKLIENLIDRFIMNEAALPAEAMDAYYEYDDTEQNVMFPHARRHGYMDKTSDTEDESCEINDCVWKKEWADMLAGQPPDLIPDYTQPPIPGTNPPVYPLKEEPNYDDLNEWNNRVMQETQLEHTPLYDVRWGQSRAAQRSDSNPGRGPWKGYFAENYTVSHPNMRTLNTYNENDAILSVTNDVSIDSSSIVKAMAIAEIPEEVVLTSRPDLIWAMRIIRKVIAFTILDGFHAWYSCQRIQKPKIIGIFQRYANLSSLGPDRLSDVLWDRYDDRKRLFWADIAIETQDYNYLWQSEVDGPHTIRQWAELAFWFPALSKAAGAKDITGIGIQNEDFGKYGEKSSRLGVETHAYMRGKPLPVVWGGYRSWCAFARGEKCK